MKLDEFNTIVLKLPYKMLKFLRNQKWATARNSFFTVKFGEHPFLILLFL